VAKDNIKLIQAKLHVKIVHQGSSQAFQVRLRAKIVPPARLIQGWVIAANVRIVFKEEYSLFQARELVMLVLQEQPRMQSS